MKLDNLPAEIKEKGLFCCWRYETRDSGKTKIPYDPASGLMARSNDPGSFVPFGIAAQAAGYDGLGLGIFNGICAIDLDDCFTAEGDLAPIAEDIVKTMNSYTEISPSGKGLHILFRTEGFRYDTIRYYIINHQNGIEIYVAGATNKYVTVTGDNFRDTPNSLEERGQELALLLEKYMLRPQKNLAVNGENAVNAQTTVLKDSDLLKKAMENNRFQKLWSGSIEGYQSQSEADLALCGLLAFWTGKDPAQMDSLFRRSGLMRAKWDEKHGHDSYGRLTIQKAIDSCSEIYRPPEPPEFAPLRPLKQQNTELPPFPVECLPRVMGSYVQAVAAHSQTSEDMAAVIGLGVLAVCLQGKYLVQGTRGYEEPLSLYTVVIAAPGERKSSVMRDMTGCLYDYEKEYNEQLQPEIRKNRQEREALQRRIEGLRDQLRRSEDKDAEMELHFREDELEDLPLIQPVRFFADDCSSEALTSLIANNGGIFSVISTEGGIFDIMAGRYSNKTNIDVWLKGHCGDSIRVDRLGREPEYIPHPALSAILTIQPSVLDEIMTNATMTGRGLIARFLYASPPSRIGSRIFCAPPIPADIGEAYRNMVFQMMAIPRPEQPSVLTLSEKATELISEHFAKHELFLAGEGQIISDWAAKYIGAVLRIAGLLHACEGPNISSEISGNEMVRAIRIGNYFLTHAGYAYSMMGTDLSIKKALFVLGRIKREQIMRIKRWELVKLCRGKFFKNGDGIQPTLALLENYGYLRTEEAEAKAGPGRKSDQIIVINPAVYQTASEAG